MVEIMLQIKTFRFKGSKTSYNINTRKHTNINDDTNVIDEYVNNFIIDNGYRLVDLKVSTVDCAYHNNGGFNEIDLIYTLIYDTQQ